MENIIDLDEFRKKCEAEGTYPLRDSFGYWFERKHGRQPNQFERPIEFKPAALELILGDLENK